MKINKWPYFDNDQIKAAIKVLKSGQVNSWTGQENKLFAEEFANWIGVKYAIPLANGSLALSAAYLSISLKEGDEIITTPRTFIATASSAVLLKIKPIFADLDPFSGAINHKTIEPLINNKTKAIVVVHLGGWPADMVNICKLAKKYKLKIIEDCSQAHGAKIKIGDQFKSVGTFGDVATWSFCQDKIISTGGEGGMLTTNDKKIYEKSWSLKDHGKTLSALEKSANKSGFKWIHENFGSNFRLTEFQSAIGRAQLKKIDKWLSLRKRNANILIEKLSDLKVINIPKPPSNIIHSWYKFHCFVVLDELKNNWDREKIVNAISKKGYPAFYGSCSEIYLEKCFTKSNYSHNQRLPIAKNMSNTNLMFLVHPTITEIQMNVYANNIKEILLKASK